MAVDHLLERGFRNFAYCGLAELIYSEQRRACFAAAVARAGYSCHEYVPQRRGSRRPVRARATRLDLRAKFGAGWAPCASRWASWRAAICAAVAQRLPQVWHGRSGESGGRRRGQRSAAVRALRSAVVQHRPGCAARGLRGCGAVGPFDAGQRSARRAAIDFAAEDRGPAVHRYLGHRRPRRGAGDPLHRQRTAAGSRWETCCATCR